MNQVAVGLLALGLLAGALAPPALAAGTPDDEMLAPSWCGPVGDCREADEFDYFWVKDGLSLKRKSAYVADSETPKFFGKKRDSNDSARTFEVTEQAPGLLTGALTHALGDDAQVSRHESEVKIVG
jgi:hypothetical protein